jgi:hypothetical protein
MLRATTQLSHQLAAVRASNLDAQWQLAEGPRLDRVVAARRLDLENSLARIYDNPVAAWNRLAEALDRGGLEKAALTLERRPADLGQLHGHALGRFETQARRDALAAAPWAGRQLRELVAATAGADALRARADGLARAIEACERHAGVVRASVRRLPDLAPLRRDLMQAGRALGTAAVNALSARAVRIFTETTRLLGRALGREHDRGHGRGDDGLGLGR